MSTEIVSLKDRLFAYGMFSLLGLAHVLPPPIASGVGGRAMTIWGRRTKYHQKMKQRVRAVLPEKSESEVERIARGVWDNLGRMFGELPHVPEMTFSREYTQILGEAHFREALRRGKGCLVLGVHTGNHERLAASGAAVGEPVFVVGTAASNPLIARKLNQLRARTVRGTMLVGSGAASKIGDIFRSNGTVGILIDRVAPRGAPVTLFGRRVLGARRPIEIAMEVGASVLFIQNIRLPKARARMVISPLERSPDIDDPVAAAEDIYVRAFREAERTIREYPEQFYWMHRHWIDPSD